MIKMRLVVKTPIERKIERIKTVCARDHFSRLHDTLDARITARADAGMFTEHALQIATLDACLQSYLGHAARLSVLKAAHSMANNPDFFCEIRVAR